MCSGTAASRLAGVEICLAILWFYGAMQGPNARSNLACGTKDENLNVGSCARHYVFCASVIGVKSKLAWWVGHRSFSAEACPKFVLQ